MRLLLIRTDTKLNEHERFQSLSEHLFECDERIARCFDDWRRSNVIGKLLALQQERLLTAEQVSHLSPGTRQRMKDLSEL